MVLYMLLYFIMVPVVYKISKCFQDKYLRQAHFILAVVCRAENNRYYLKRGVECRPGYLGRWIEFNVLDNLEGRVDLVQLLKDRQTAALEQAKRNVEDDHQRYQGGINRNLNQQAVDLRIQIEENVKARPLTAIEKQEIVNL